MTSRLLIVIMSVIALLCDSAVAQDDEIMLPHYPDCSAADNYTDGSQYKKNLDQLLAVLPVAAGDNGWFYNGTVGTGADQVFGLIMCFADCDAKQCQGCLAGAAAGITTVCPGSRNVSAVYDACVLRYTATAPLPAIANGSYKYLRYIKDPDSWQEARSVWVPLFANLTDGVATSPLLLANHSVPFSTNATYGMAQCTRDLNDSECRRCITAYTGQLWNLFLNDTGGAIKGYSCYLRFQIGAFDITQPPAPLARSPPPVTPPPPALLALAPLAPPPPLLVGSSSSSKTGFAIGLSVGSASFLIILGSSMWLLLRRWRKQDRIHDEWRKKELEEGSFLNDDPEMEEEFKKGTGPKQFRYSELASATGNFANDRKLGEGGFGSVYRGFLKEMNLEVAIKRVSKDSKQGRKEYASEVRIISRLGHRNLVQLLSWCHDGGELLLVYELMPNSSLDKHLYKAKSTGLPWPLRHEIVLGLGSALLYLHQEWEQCVVHRDIKPSN